MAKNTFDMQEIRSVITDAGQTAAGVGKKAVEMVNEVRSDLTSRYETQVSDARKQALSFVNTIESARETVEARIEPMVSKVTEMLPTPAQKVIETATESIKSIQVKAHDMVVKALSEETVVAKSAKSAATKVASAAKAATKPAAKATPKKSSTKPAAKATKPARKPRTTVATPVVEETVAAAV